ncbi:MAG: DUF3606 domain-containing protein [Sphingomonadales bacterium]|nr:DUF3606 domain-containing protein [Sphingomonadales bacterium]
MSDDTTKRAATDRTKVAGGEGYELRYFARKHGLTTAQAMDLIRRIGNDRAKLNEAAVRLRRGLPAKPT